MTESSGPVAADIRHCFTPAPDPLHAPAQRKVWIFGLCVRIKNRRTFAPTDPPVVIVGDCLRPWLKSGDVVWFERAVEPQDGDLVVCRMLYRRSSPDVLGAAVMFQQRLAVKQLRLVAGKRFLCAVDDYVSADAHEILGTVTAWYRPGWWRRPPVRTMRLDPVIDRRREVPMTEGPCA